jgi:hypothetical protein
MKGARNMSPEGAEALAIQALSFLAEDSERLTRFFSVTGLDPGGIREAASSPGFLAGVLAYLASDEKLASEFIAAAPCSADDIFRAHAALGGEPWEREIP